MTRLEHENLASEVTQNTRMLERIEIELRTLRDVVDGLQARNGKR